MLVFIPTRGRFHQQFTRRWFHLDRLHGVNGIEVFYVVPECELRQWEEDQWINGEKWPPPVSRRVFTVPDEYRFSDIRQHILEYFPQDPYHICIDDDMYIYRRAPGDTKLLTATPEDVLAMFEWIHTQLDVEGFAHGGVSGREGNNREPDQEVMNTRCMRLHFYNRNILMAEGLKFTDIAAKQDFHMTLSLLELGYPNVVNFEFAHNQVESNSPGGCSRYRDAKMLEEMAHRLKELHPDFVTVVDKETKGSFGGGVRKDVRIAWKKALGTRASDRKWKP